MLYIIERCLIRRNVRTQSMTGEKDIFVLEIKQEFSIFIAYLL